MAVKHSYLPVRRFLFSPTPRVSATSPYCAWTTASSSHQPDGNNGHGSEMLKSNMLSANHDQPGGGKCQQITNT